MNTRLAQELKLNELRNEFRSHLQRENFAGNTVNTVSNDAFYLWRSGGRRLFWSVVTSLEFAKRARKELRKHLEINSKGDVERNLNGYVKNLRRFREFVLDIHTPDEAQLQHYIDVWNGLIDYQNQEAALDKLFALCPKNTDIRDVLLKSAVLNDFYSTQIFDINPVAENIVGLNIDSRLQKGDLSLVGDISNVQMSDGKQYCFYSFASKFCSHHRPDIYPIYDSFVDTMLCYFQKRDRFYSFKSKDLEDYFVFCEVMEAFRKYYGLTGFGFKLVDKYLWLLGKDFFPKKYKPVSDD